jgi:hypothetical protein
MEVYKKETEERNKPFGPREVLNKLETDLPAKIFA